MTVQTSLEWAATIPNGWRVVPLKRVCKFTSGWTPPTGDSAAYVGENLWANISDVGPRVIRDTAKRLSDDAVKRHSIALSPAGSLLFSFKLSVGQVSFAGEDMFTNEAIATFLPNHALDLNFAYYAFPEMIVRNASENIYGAKILNQQLINSAPLVLPPRPEQTAIAAFLDRETGKIDALVEEQRRLIELLKEKRLAVISHAVTKGVDPNARMKPSSVEWLRDVPEHWEMAPIKRVSSLITSGPRGWSDQLTDEGHVFFQSQNIGRGMEMVLDDCKRILPDNDAESQRAALSVDDVVVCITGARTGAVAHVIQLVEPAFVNQHVCLVRSRGIKGRFMAYFLSSRAGQQQLQVAMYGLKQGLSLEDIRETVLLLPSETEQCQITAWLDSQTARIDALVNEAESQLVLLAERRSALISAAVTGKIDVRNTVTQTVAA
ncbi:restriction endonuclease subunit S [Rhizobium ruizarguesonis]